MNFVYKIVAIIYRTFDDRGLDIPYFRAIVLILFLFFLNAVSLSLFLRLPSYYLMPWSSEDAKIIQWAFATCFVLVPILLLTVVFNKKALDKIEVTDKQINRGRKILPIYILVSLIVLVTLLIWHGSQEGKVIVR